MLLRHTHTSVKINNPSYHGFSAEPVRFILGNITWFLVTGLVQIIVRLIISYFGMNYVSPLKKRKKEKNYFSDSSYKHPS